MKDSNQESEDRSENGDSKEWVKDMANFLHLGMELVFSVFAGLGLGWLAAKHLGFPEWFTVILALVGLVVGLYRIWILGKKREL